MKAQGRVPSGVGGTNLAGGGYARDDELGLGPKRGERRYARNPHAA